LLFESIISRAFFSSQEEFMGELFIIADNYILNRFICQKHSVKKLLGGWWNYNWNLSAGDGAKPWRQGHITEWALW
jgi:hypothetical protein